MKETKIIFELITNYEELDNEVRYHIRKSSDFYRKTKVELLTFEIKLLQKSKLYFSSFVYEGLQLKEKNSISEEEQRIIDGIIKELDFVDRYSKYNIFAWVKRYHKLNKKFAHQLYEHKEYSRHLLSRLKKLNNELQPYKHTKVVTGILQSNEVLRENLLSIVALKFDKFDCYRLIEELFIVNPTMKKNEILNMINIRKDKYTLGIVNDLPENMSIEDFETAVFVESIEEDSNCYLNKVIAKHVFKLRDANPKLAKEMDEKIGIDMIPTMSVSLDEYGEVSEIKQNPPKLKLVK